MPSSGCVFQLEQAVVKEMAWFKDTAHNLEKLKTINLDPQLVAEQLNEQKVRTTCNSSNKGIWSKRVHRECLRIVFKIKQNMSFDLDFSSRDPSAQIQH